MNIPAVQHHAGYPDVYLASRKRLVVTIHAAAGDIKTCELLVFPRTAPEKISSYPIIKSGSHIVPLFIAYSIVFK